MNSVRLLVTLLSVAAVVLPVVLIQTLNVNKKTRFNQMRYPLIAVVFSVFSCALFTVIGKVMNKIVQLNNVQKILNLISPDGKFDYTVLVYTAIVVNVVLLFVFFAVKSAARIGINKKKIPEDFDDIKGIKKLYWLAVSVFYDLTPKRGIPRRNWVKVQKTLKYASWIISALCFLLIIFIQLPIFSSQSWVPYDFLRRCVKALYMWPVISLIAVNEFRWFLDGKEEYSKPSKMVFDHSELKNVSDYGELAEQYKLQFPERFGGYIVGTAKGSVSNYYNDVRAETRLEEAIAEQLRGRGYTINTNYLSCIKHLANGENALIDASIFSDFGEYLFLYLNTLLARGDNVLFVCADDEAAETFAEYISDKFKTVNNYHRVWIVKDNSNIHGRSDADILVITPQMVLDENAFIGQAKFISRLSTVIMVNTAEVIAKDGTILTLLAHKLTKTIKKDATIRTLRYICLSESVPPETSNALKQILNLQSDLYICDGYQSFDNTHLMLWNYESGCAISKDKTNTEYDGKSTLAQDNLFGNNTTQTYWGVSFPLACVGMKYMVSKISIISHSGTPYFQIINSIKNQVNRLSEFFNYEIGFTDFDEIILLNRVNNEDSHTAFFILEDDLFNLPLSIYNYCRFGGTDTTMIHIVSKPYMLRDYFMANAKEYINNESKINMIMPSLSDTKHIVVIKILCEALEGGIEQNDLYRRIKGVEPSVETVEQALEFCRDIVFPEGARSPIEYYFSFVNKSQFSRDAVAYDNITYIRLKLNTPLAKLLQSSKQAKMELRGKLFNLGVLSDHLYQHFVPSQSLVHRGNLYTVESIDVKEGIVHVREASDRLNSPVDYVQVRTYELKDNPHIVDLYPVPYDPNEKRLTTGYEVALFKHTKISVDTTGYYALNAVNAKLDLVNGPSYKVMSDEDRKAAARVYNDAGMISFKIKGVGADKSDRVSFLLAVIMNEMMKTVFPYSYKCISVCPVLTDKGTIYNDSLGSRIKNAYPQIILGDFYKHNPEDVEVLIVEDSLSETGMLKTLLQDEQYPFKLFFDVTRDYLNWYNSFEEIGNVTNKYLYFGADKAPDCFDFATLTTICNEFETVKRRGPIKVDRVTSKGQCSYCHRDLFNVEYTEIKDHAGKNNRKLCSKCAKLIVTDENELKKLYKRVRKYLCETFKIELPDDINVRFATAEKIRKKLNTGDRRVVVGFFDLKTHELWVEADAPSANVIDVLAHELTHAWQQENIKMTDLVYIEGHASYVEVQYMRYENRKAFAEWQEESLNSRDDEYGEGFRRLKEELDDRQDYNSFSYMLELFGEGGSGRPPEGGGHNPTGGDDGKGDDGKGNDGNGDDGKGDDGNGDDGKGDDGEGKSSEHDSGEKNRTPGACPKYAYNLLSPEKKKIYDLIKNAILSFKPEVIIEDGTMMSEDVVSVIDYIRIDSPEIFWLGNDITIGMEPVSNTVKEVNINYCMTIETAVSRQKEIDVSLAPFFESVNSNMSDYEVVRKIYQNIIGLVDYDSLGLNESESNPKSNKPDDLRSIYGAFVNKKAVCAGYAVATQYLLNRVGIECAYICGKTNRGYHAWNLIKLEGDYYYMDTTWGDRSNTDKAKSDEGIGYDYFCITTKELLVDHIPDADPAVPYCTATKCNYYVRSGLFFTEYSIDKVKTAVKKSIDCNQLEIPLKFSDENAYDSAYNALIDGEDVQKIISFVNSSNMRISTSYKYSDVREKRRIGLHFSKV